MRFFLPRISDKQLLLIEDELHAVIASGQARAWLVYAPDYEVPERIAEGIRMLAQGSDLKRNIHDFTPTPDTLTHLHTMAKLFFQPSSNREIIRMERVLRRLIRKGLKERMLILEKTGLPAETLGFPLHQLALAATPYTP